MKSKALILLIMLISVVILVSFGCGRKQEVSETTESISDEELTTKMEEPAVQEAAMPTPVPMETTEPQAELIPVAPTSQPAELPTDRNRQIQTALKNAGYYQGAIDGKIGPKSKKAIRDFQEAKGLKVDGKVGPKTWAELEKYLTTSGPTQ